MVVEFFYVWKIVYILMKYFFFDEYLFLIFKIKIFIINMIIRYREYWNKF